MPTSPPQPSPRKPDVTTDAPVWETWDGVFLKTTTLGHEVIRRTLEEPGERITRIAVVPRGGLYLVNVLSRMLGLSGAEVLSLSISKYDREHPTRAGDFPDRLIARAQRRRGSGRPAR